MKKIIYYCDFCGKEIPFEHKKDMFNKNIKIFKTGKSKYVDFFRIGCDCCVECALKIDLGLTEFKLQHQLK